MEPKTVFNPECPQSWIKNIEQTTAAIALIQEARKIGGKRLAEHFWVNLGLPVLEEPEKEAQEPKKPEEKVPVIQIMTDRVIHEINKNGGSVSRTVMLRALQYHMKARDIESVIKILKNSGLITEEISLTKGRSARIYHLKTEEN